ncbi:Hypothetical predicted protein [Paramuricea clavata]|uniref:Uncharacterized protein n=1 Tax=Paramuricea clavata TaxID=317549 RepID=A0A7D9EE19_PARCT|nr:Hypothetical predicted protein [Paramuricea clavata]
MDFGLFGCELIQQRGHSPIDHDTSHLVRVSPKIKLALTHSSWSIVIRQQQEDEHQEQQAEYFSDSIMATFFQEANYQGPSKDKTRDCSDITASGPLPNGAQSAKVEGKNNWLVYGGKNEAEPSAELVAGKAYPNVESMGLPAGTIIKSIKIKA